MEDRESLSSRFSFSLLYEASTKLAHNPLQIAALSTTGLIKQPPSKWDSNVSWCHTACLTEGMQCDFSSFTLGHIKTSKL